MATCNTATLLAGSDCYQCLSDKEISLVIVTFLCQILQRIDPMATCDVESVRAASAQYSIMDNHQLRAAMVYLLCEIQALGLGGASVHTDTVDPVADPGIPSQIWINRTSGQVWYWNDGSGAWDLLIA